MQPKISPYHFRVITQRFALTDPEPNMPDAWVTDIPRTVMDRFIRLLQPCIGKERVKNLAHLETLRGKRLAQYEEERLAGEDYEGWDRYVQSVTNFLHHALGSVRYGDGVDWQGFSDFVQALEPRTRSKVDTLLNCFIGMPSSQLLAPASKWCLSPTKINELEGGRDILGRLFVPKDGGRWIRADRVVQAFGVLMHSAEKEWDDEESREYTTIRRHVIGTTATLAGAFEIAEQAVAQVQVRYDDHGVTIGTGRPMPFKVQIFEGTDSWINRQPIIAADITPDKSPPGQPRIDTARARWIEPYSEAECAAATIKLEQLRKENVENSLADNYSTCKQLTQEMALIQSRFPVEGYPGHEVMDTLRRTLVIIGAHKSLTELLEVDLGL